jgi:hypothetical protein
MSDEIDDDGDVPTFNQTDDSPDEEAAPKRGTPEGFTGDEEEHDAPGSGPRRRREYSSKTRELFKAASAKLKAQLAAGESVDAFEVAIQDDPDPDEADLEAAAVDPETPDPAAEAAATTEEAAKPPEGAPDPRVIKEWEAINEERRAIAAERAAVAALRQENDYEELRERFVESPGTAAADLIKRWSPGATENEVRELAIDLITELSGQVLGVTISPEAKERLARRSSDRAVSAWKAQQAREKAEAPKRQAEAEQAARERGAITRIDLVRHEDGLPEGRHHDEVAGGGRNPRERIPNPSFRLVRQAEAPTLHGPGQGPGAAAAEDERPPGRPVQHQQVTDAHERRRRKRAELAPHLRRGDRAAVRPAGPPQSLPRQAGRERQEGRRPRVAACGWRVGPSGDRK